MKKLPRILIRIEVALIAATFLFSVILIANEHSKKYLGVWFETGFYGVSMHPTIDEDSLVLLKSVPFGEVEVGDCIQFKKRVKIAVTSSKMRLVPAGNDEAGVDSTAAVNTAADTTPVVEKDSPVLYDPDENVLHRVVEKTDEGLFTRGDNNSGNDQYPVIADGLIGKVIWTKHWLGWPFCVMYKYFGLVWLMGATILWTAGLAVVYCVINRRGAEKNKPRS